MSDENWPAPTPRDELLARVAARGTRIRAVRGAVNALVVLSVVGASALGVGVAIDGLGSGAGTEVDNIAMVPDPPEGDESAIAPDAPTQMTGPIDETGDTTVSDPGSTGVPDSTTSVDGAGTVDSTVGPGAGGRGPSSGPSTTPTTSGRPDTSSSTTTDDSPTATEPVTTTSEVPAPRVGTMRTKVDGDVPTGEKICSAPTTEVAVEVEDAQQVSLSWSQAGEHRVTRMAPENSEWSAAVPLLDAGPTAEVAVTLTVTATGPGGTTKESRTIEVIDCTSPGTGSN